MLVEWEGCPRGSERVSLSVVSKFCDPVDYSYKALLCPWNSPGKNTGVGCHSLPEDLSDPGIKPRSPVLQADSLPSEPIGRGYMYTYN